VPEQKTSPPKLPDGTPIPKPQKPPPRTGIRVASVGKVIDDAPEGDGHRAVLPNCLQDFPGKRMFNACRFERMDLRRVRWCDDDHVLTTQLLRLIRFGIFAILYVEHFTRFLFTIRYVLSRPCSSHAPSVTGTFLDVRNVVKA
jgi:hypothetical protein